MRLHIVTTKLKLSSDEFISRQKKALVLYFTKIWYWIQVQQRPQFSAPSCNCYVHLPSLFNHTLSCSALVLIQSKKHSWNHARGFTPTGLRIRPLKPIAQFRQNKQPQTSKEIITATFSRRRRLDHTPHGFRTNFAICWHMIMHYVELVKFKSNTKTLVIISLFFYWFFLRIFTFTLLYI